MVPAAPTAPVQRAPEESPETAVWVTRLVQVTEPPEAVGLPVLKWVAWFSHDATTTMTSPTSTENEAVVKVAGPVEKFPDAGTLKDCLVGGVAMA